MLKVSHFTNNLVFSKGHIITPFQAWKEMIKHSVVNGLTDFNAFKGNKILCHPTLEAGFCFFY